MTLSPATPIFFVGLCGMSSTPFGEHLKREREMRGVSLEEISAATRINTRYLEALEKAHWSALPGGAFNRGFIRSVARFLGLDEENLIAEYSLETKESPDAAHPAAEIPRDWKPVLSAISLLILIALLVVAGIFGYRFYRAHRAARQQPAATASPLPASTQAPTEHDSGSEAPVAPSGGAH